jgi:predicted membrane protein
VVVVSSPSEISSTELGVESLLSGVFVLCLTVVAIQILAFGIFTILIGSALVFCGIFLIANEITKKIKNNNLKNESKKENVSASLMDNGKEEEKEVKENKVEKCFSLPKRTSLFFGVFCKEEQINHKESANIITPINKL